MTQVRDEFQSKEAEGRSVYCPETVAVENSSHWRLARDSISRSGIRVSSSGPWLDHPLSGWWCALGWLATTVVFIGVVRLFGGPAHVDVEESVHSTWAIAHGQLACAYPLGPLLRSVRDRTGRLVPQQLVGV
jgi:hypothetical protein